MIKKKRKKRKSNTTPTPPSVILLEDGRKRIRQCMIDKFIFKIEDETEEYRHSLRYVGGPPRIQCSEAYDIIFIMCIQKPPHNYSAQLYDFYSQEVTKYFKGRATDELIKSQKNNLMLLKEWIKRWRHAKYFIDGMCRVFMFLDRFYVPNNEPLLNISSAGYLIYFKHFFKPNIDQIIQITLQYVYMCRDAKYNDNDSLLFVVDVDLKHVIQNIMDSIVELNSKLCRPSTKRFITMSEERIGLLFSGYVREFEMMNKSIIIPYQMIKIMKRYYHDDGAIYYWYFFSSFIKENIEFFSVKAEQYINQYSTLYEYVKQCNQIIQTEINDWHFHSKYQQLFIDTLIHIFYNEKLLSSRLNALYPAVLFSMRHISKINVYIVDVLQSLRYLECHYKHICDTEIDGLVSNLSSLFKAYISNSKHNVDSEDLYCKYQLLYDSYTLYKHCQIHNVYVKKVHQCVIEKRIESMLFDLIQHKYEFIMTLLVDFIDHILMHCDHVTDINGIMTFIGNVYNWIRIRQFPKRDNSLFYERYKIKFANRRTTNIASKGKYFEQRMLESLEDRVLVRTLS